MSCKLMGVDSSTAKTGVSVFTDGCYTNAFLIDKSKIKDTSEKFNQMCLNIVSVLNNEKPDIVVIERMHTLRNADSFRKLCKIMGIVQGWCILNNSEYIEMSPTEWRKLVANDDEKIPRKRDELKLWSVDKVRCKYDIEVTDDISDAICIGEAYINRYKGV